MADDVRGRRLSPSARPTERVAEHLRILYPDQDIEALVARVFEAIGPPSSDPAATRRWTEGDTVLITYADSLLDPPRPPLQVLAGALDEVLGEVEPIVHVLPFHPSSSDGGFAVIDHHEVDPTLGTWDDIERLSGPTGLMADIVLNHVSAASDWFRQFLADQPPGRDYFVTASPEEDLTEVVRPRTGGVLQRVRTPAGDRHVWCTFGPDQMDLDYRNPDVLLELLRMIDAHLGHGVRMLRLDAVAYVWKRPGTPCIHLPETHELVKLLRTVLQYREPQAVIVTETNVPEKDNLSYLGSGDEAHVAYNFALPPLLVHTLTTGDSSRLRSWLAERPPIPGGCTLLNFVQSHDGIGLRPADGLLNPAETDALVELTHARGGSHSAYAAVEGPRPYELNITLADLLEFDQEPGPERLLCTLAIAASLDGVPALYVHSLFATPNDEETANRTGVARDLNRAKLDWPDLRNELAAGTSPRAGFVTRLVHLLSTRRGLPAMAPGSGQVLLDTPDQLLAIRRGTTDPLTAVFNVTPTPVQVDTRPLGVADRAMDALTGEVIRPLVELQGYGFLWAVGGT